MYCDLLQFEKKNVNSEKKCSCYYYFEKTVY